MRGREDETMKGTWDERDEKQRGRGVFPNTQHLAPSTQHPKICGVHSLPIVPHHLVPHRLVPKSSRPTSLHSFATMHGMKQ